MKTRTSILIESEILKTAQELGINVSKACENALILYINSLQNANQKITANQNAFPEKGSIGTVGSDQMVRPPGFEPGSSAWQNGNVDWEAFRVWVAKDHRPEVTRDIVNYSRRFAHCLLNRDLSEIRDLRPTLRVNVVKALSSLAKFLGVYEDYKRLLRDYGLSWKGKSVDDYVIDRLVRTRDPDEVFAWVREVKRLRPDLKEFMDFICVTGLRLNEAVQSFNLIIELSKKGELSSYYNEQTETLEHFKFKDVFIRKSKKAFISFVPKSLIEKIKDCRPITSKDAIQSLVKKRGLKIRFADIREAHNTLLTKYLNQSEIDFIAGRVSSNIFMSNYYNPKMVSDLKERMFKAIAEIQNKIREA